MILAILVVGHVGLMVFVLACIADNRIGTVKPKRSAKHRRPRKQRSAQIIHKRRSA